MSEPAFSILPGDRGPSRDPLRIALISPVWFPVPPPRYGGTEVVVSLLADGLADAGHDVTLFASGDSGTRARLSFVYERAPSWRIASRCRSYFTASPATSARRSST